MHGTRLEYRLSKDAKKGRAKHENSVTRVHFSRDCNVTLSVTEKKGGIWRKHGFL